MCCVHNNSRKKRRKGGKNILMGKNESQKQHKDGLCRCVREGKKAKRLESLKITKKYKSIHSKNKTTKIADVCNGRNEHLRMRSVLLKKITVQMGDKGIEQESDAFR